MSDQTECHHVLSLVGYNGGAQCDLCEKTWDVDAMLHAAEIGLNRLAELEAAKAREEAKEKDTGLRCAEALARRLYRIVKHPDNAGVGKISLHYQEPDGSIGVVLVLAPDKGNAAIIDAVEAIYSKQDVAASEPPGTREGMSPVERLMADASEPPGTVGEKGT